MWQHPLLPGQLSSPNPGWPAVPAGAQAGLLADVALDPWRCSPPHLLLLSHDLQLLGQLDLALALCLLCCAPQLLPMLLPQRVQGPTRVPDLGQFVLQAFVIHCGGRGSLRDPLEAEHSDCPCTLLWLLSRQAAPRECQTLALGDALAGARPSPGPPARSRAAPTYACAHPAG